MSTSATPVEPLVTRPEIWKTAGLPAVIVTERTAVFPFMSVTRQMIVRCVAEA